MNSSGQGAIGGPDFEGIIGRALERRRGLAEDRATTAWRVLHGEEDGTPGLVIECFGDVLIAQLHEERLEWDESVCRALAERLKERLGARAVYRKYFLRDRAQAPDAVTAEHTRPEAWIGEAVEPELTVLENGMRFLIHPYEGFSVGLFLEHRDNRAWVRRSAVGRRVLNGFCYTCGFSVAAATGGAVGVDSVDVHKRYLEWGKRNFEANGLGLGAHRFFCSDVLDFYARATRQGRRYDLIVLDPPTFARLRRPSRTFVLQDELEVLCRGAVELLEPGGMILVATNDRRIGAARVEEVLTGAAPGRVSIVQRPGLPADFPGDPRFSKTVIARLG